MKLDLTIKKEIDSMEESYVRRKIAQENFCAIFFSFFKLHLRLNGYTASCKQRSQEEMMWHIRRHLNDMN